jgi:hypothetical protein
MAFIQNVALGTFEKTCDLRSGRKAWKFLQFWNIDLILVTAIFLMASVSFRQWTPP